jgi:rhodanese-related sulfurtransferase
MIRCHSLEDVDTAVAEDPPPFLLDVREASEKENGHIETAVHIPLRELGQHVDLMPSFDTPIIFYCGSGYRSTIAYAVLETLGWANVTTIAADNLPPCLRQWQPIPAIIAACSTRS